MLPPRTPALRFHQLLRYLERMGVDPTPIVANAHLDLMTLQATSPAAELPTYDYATLYQHAAAALQHLYPGVVWGAGVGTDVFRFRCYAMICCTSLSSALERAAEFDRLIRPLTGYGMRYRPDNGLFRISCDVDREMAGYFLQPGFSPHDDNSQTTAAIASASSLRMWYALIGWLIGRNPPVIDVYISSSHLPPVVQERLEHLFGIPMTFNATECSLSIPVSYLNQRIIQDPRSLDIFLENAVYNLMLQGDQRLNVSAAIRSLLMRDMADHLPTLEVMAAQLHMSPSNMRRRLQQEGTSYQKIKDQVRYELARRHLCERHLKVHEIASMLGFNEPGSFIRSFRNWSGMTPRQFQDQMLCTQPITTDT